MTGSGTTSLPGLRAPLGRGGGRDRAAASVARRLPGSPLFWHRVGRAADHGVLWGAVGAVLVAGPGAARRAGIRGTTAAVATTTVVHLVAKPLLPRAHPEAGRFPSAHAASAAAFAVGAAMESPTIGAVVGPVAAAVAWARVGSGDRRVGEVAAGVALGASLAAVTRRWWPVHQSAPARARTTGSVPALGDGAGLVVVANEKAGTAAGTPSGSILEVVAAGVTPGADPAEEQLSPADAVREVLPLAEVVVPEPGKDLVAEVEAVIARPGRTPVVAVGAAGGDGSMAAMAGVAERYKLPLVVVPAGTLNHFARDVGVAEVSEALTAARDGSAVLVDLAEVRTEHERITFVNTASLGGYPDMVRLREDWQDRWGKWPSALMALARVLSEAAPLAVEIDGRPRTIWMLFVGNGGYHPLGMAPLYRPRLDGRILDVRYLRADLPFSRLRFVTAALAGALHRSRVYVQQRSRSVDVHIVGDPVGLATDGEVWGDAREFRFAVAPEPVAVYRPPHL